MKLPVICGAMFRRTFRRALDAAAIPYTEDKGWLDSQFIVDVTETERLTIAKWMAAVNAA